MARKRRFRQRVSKARAAAEYDAWRAAAGVDDPPAEFTRVSLDRDEQGRLKLTIEAPGELRQGKLFEE